MAWNLWITIFRSKYSWSQTVHWIPPVISDPLDLVSPPTCGTSDIDEWPSLSSFDLQELLLSPSGAIGGVRFHFGATNWGVQGIRIDLISEASGERVDKWVSEWAPTNVNDVPLKKVQTT